MKKSKRKRNVVLIILFIVVVGASGFGINYWHRTEKYQESIKNLRIKEVDLATLEDGEYIGEYDVDFISAKVKVTIANHNIQNIEYIYHNNDRGEKASAIKEDMVEQQKIKVDAISGATNSSKVIQKAVELALSEK
ncbi:hypothetical protein IGI37_001097 [Enterococcus sp. AZ194]|uniref:FMN-binding protein n=1 Tax=Enterococcus sp. AZ194 TaxID=2774629 RepID=UPI003F298B2C